MSHLPLIPYLDEQTETLRSRLPDAIGDFDEDAIHKSRVATRRIKAAVALAQEAGLQDAALEQLENTGKKVRRALGALRDADVMLGHLAKLPARFAEPVAWLSEHIRRQRGKDRDKARKAVDVAKVLGKLGKWWGVRETIAARPVPAEPMIASIHVQAQELGSLADAMVAGEDGIDPHAIRIDAKRLRYTLEMAEVAAVRMPQDALKHFKKVQDSLGEWHDFAVLADVTAELLARHQLPLHDGPLATDVAKLLIDLLRRAEKSLNDFHRQWTATGRGLLLELRDASIPEEGVSTPGVEPLEA